MARLRGFPSVLPSLTVGTLEVTGAATFAATVTATGQFLGGDGSAAAPSYSFTNFVTAGMYAFAGGVGLSYGGLRASITALGVVINSGQLLGWAPGGAGSPADVILSREAANVLSLKNGTNAQELRIWGTTGFGETRYLSLSNDGVDCYISNPVNASIFFGTAGVTRFTVNGVGASAAVPFLALDGSTASPSFSFANDTNTGIYRSNADELAFVTGGAGRWAFTSSGHFLAGANNTYDIGATGAMPRTIYAGTSVFSPLYSLASNQFVQYGDANTMYFGVAYNNGYTVAMRGQSLTDAGLWVLRGIGLSGAGSGAPTPDAYFFRIGAASIRVGGESSATPVAQTFTIGEASRPGTDTDVGGANGTIRSGLGTGTGTPSKIVLLTPTAVASGSGVQTYDSCFVALGGITSAFPALKRNGAILQAVLADSSAYAAVDALIYKIGDVQVVGARKAAVADATGAGDIVAQFNTLLARLRATGGHGLIAD